MVHLTTLCHKLLMAKMAKAAIVEMSQASLDSWRGVVVVDVLVVACLPIRRTASTSTCDTVNVTAATSRPAFRVDATTARPTLDCSVLITSSSVKVVAA